MLYHLVSNIWKFSFSPKFEDGRAIPTLSIWQFNLEGNVIFLGNTYGEGHPCLSWRYSNGSFFIEGSYRYGLIECKFDKLNIKLNGESTLDDDSVVIVTGEIAKPLNDKLFYNSFKSYLINKTWRINILGTLDLVYIKFGAEKLELFDAFGLKTIYSKEHLINLDYLDEGIEVKIVEYIYFLESHNIKIFEKEKMEKVGNLFMDNNMTITGYFKPGYRKRKFFVELTIMYDYLIREVIESITEDQRIFSL